MKLITEEISKVEAAIEQAKRRGLLRELKERGHRVSDQQVACISQRSE